MLNAVVKSSAPGGIVDFVKTVGEYSMITLAQSIITFFLLSFVLASNQAFKLDLLFFIISFSQFQIRTHFIVNHHSSHRFAFVAFNLSDVFF
jgi:hypothetical protein